MTTARQSSPRRAGVRTSRRRRRRRREGEACGLAGLARGAWRVYVCVCAVPLQCGWRLARRGNAMAGAEAQRRRKQAGGARTRGATQGGTKLDALTTAAGSSAVQARRQEAASDGAGVACCALRMAGAGNGWLCCPPSSAITSLCHARESCRVMEGSKTPTRVAAVNVRTMARITFSTEPLALCVLLVCLNACQIAAIGDPLALHTSQMIVRHHQISLAPSDRVPVSLSMKSRVMPAFHCHAIS